MIPTIRSFGKGKGVEKMKRLMVARGRLRWEEGWISKHRVLGPWNSFVHYCSDGYTNPKNADTTKSEP